MTNKKKVSAAFPSVADLLHQTENLTVAPSVVEIPKDVPTTIIRRTKTEKAPFVDMNEKRGAFSSAVRPSLVLQMKRFCIEKGITIGDLLENALIEYMTK